MTLMARKLLLQPQLKIDREVITTAGQHTLELPVGLYQWYTRGGGGCGGDAGKKSSSNIVSGDGGAGAPGLYKQGQFYVYSQARIEITVGQGGQRVADGGNGGAGGAANGGSGAGGAGGGAGDPTEFAVFGDVTQVTFACWQADDGDILWEHVESSDSMGSGIANSTVTFMTTRDLITEPVEVVIKTPLLECVANGKTYRRKKEYDDIGPIVQSLANGSGGGAGGGGGGGAGGSGRYSNGGSSGGGGGYKRYDWLSRSVTSIPGMAGQVGAGYFGSGTAGRTGNIADFPAAYSGAGTAAGYTNSPGRNAGGAGASGGGASGGAGGGSAGNHDSSFGGGGGAGAGGDYEAGGGTGGNSSQKGRGGSGYNAYVDARQITMPLSGAVSALQAGCGGSGGTNAGNGTPGRDGFFILARVA